MSRQSLLDSLEQVRPSQQIEEGVRVGVLDVTLHTLLLP